MTADRLCFHFDERCPLEDIVASLLMARWAAEALYGEPTIQIDARHRLDTRRRECVIDTLTAAGRDLARLFLGFVRREFAPNLFRVEPLRCEQSTPAVA